MSPEGGSEGIKRGCTITKAGRKIPSPHLQLSAMQGTRSRDQIVSPDNGDGRTEANFSAEGSGRKRGRCRRTDGRNKQPHNGRECYHPPPPRPHCAQVGREGFATKGLFDKLGRDDMHPIAIALCIAGRVKTYHSRARGNLERERERQQGQLIIRASIKSKASTRERKGEWYGGNRRIGTGEEQENQ